MTLFFYGALQVQEDRATLEQSIHAFAKELDWTIDSQPKESIALIDALGIASKSPYLVFEIASLQVDAYDEIYGDYDGEKMQNYYRFIAKNLGIPAWESLDFASHELVTEVYASSPYPELPITKFMDKVFRAYPQKHIVLAIDHDFDNRFECSELQGEAKRLIIRAWETICFGYDWPNFRLSLNAL